MAPLRASLTMGATAPLTLDAAVPLTFAADISN
jgi:hypothetical protein